MHVFMLSASSAGPRTTAQNVVHRVNCMFVCLMCARCSGKKPTSSLLYQTAAQNIALAPREQHFRSFFRCCFPQGLLLKLSLDFEQCLLKM